jgi:hypothetical protein
MKKDLTGKKFNRLIVKSLKGTNKYGKRLWECICDCGKKIVVDTSSLTTGNTKSCGCYKQDLIKKLNFKHGSSHTKLYYVWQSMINRCYKKNNKQYKNYGDRGITVCKEWVNDYYVFYFWAVNNGYKEGLTIDRINNNGNYEPLNCRWVDYQTQARNKTTNRYVNIDNKNILISVACKLYNINLSSVFSRSKRHNISLQEAFNYYLFNDRRQL